MDDYDVIEVKIREARRLRAEAAGELFAAGWQRLQHFASRVSHAIVGQLRAHHLLHH